MTKEISMEGVTIIEAGADDSISVHTYYGNEGGYKGKHIIIRRNSGQAKVPESAEKHSVSDLSMARAVMVNEPSHCYSDVMALMSRETELSKSIRKIYREYGFNTKNEGIPKMVQAVDLEIEHIDCLPLHI